MGSKIPSYSSDVDIYGADTKVHSKICQITYKTEEGFKYIIHRLEQEIIMKNN